MQLTYVFSELGNGLRRNLSMTIAVIVTMFVSLTLVGLGLLLNTQADKAEEFWGDRLQITVFLCTPNSPGTACIDGKVTEQQKEAVTAVLDDHPQVKEYHYESSQTAYRKWREVYTSGEDTQQQVIDAVKPNDLAESYWVTLKDPQEFEGVKSAVAELPGVSSVRDLRQVLQPIYFWISAFKWGAIVIAGFLLLAAILQVGNTIRLAAFARRKEIGIMRLVGASSLYIQLPFLLEGVLAGVLGGVVASLLCAAAQRWIVNATLREKITIAPFVGWEQFWTLTPVLILTGVLLAGIASFATLRKYLRV